MTGYARANRYQLNYTDPYHREIQEGDVLNLEDAKLNSGIRPTFPCTTRGAKFGPKSPRPNPVNLPGKRHTVWEHARWLWLHGSINTSKFVNRMLAALDEFEITIREVNVNQRYCIPELLDKLTATKETALALRNGVVEAPKVNSEAWELFKYLRTLPKEEQKELVIAMTPAERESLALLSKQMLNQSK